MQKDNPKITAEDVVEIVQLLEKNDIDVIIDGGWSVDALLGKQTRMHEDLDVAVQNKDVEKIRELFEARGYKDIPRDDSWECNFVLGDDKGRQIDIHSYTFDADEKHIFGVEYPYDSLNGTGVINGHQVKCISPEWLVKFHIGYKLDENDYHDVKLLCQKFGFKIPDEYNGFVLKDKQKQKANS